MTTNLSDDRHHVGPQLTDIAFRPLTVNDMPLMHRWLNEPHVCEWWDDPAAYGAVVARYLPRIGGRDPARPFVILNQKWPIGYIQAYRYSDYPDFTQHLAFGEDPAGLDLFIGEPACVHRGLGRLVLTERARRKPQGLNLGG